MTVALSTPQCRSAILQGYYYPSGTTSVRAAIRVCVCSELSLLLIGYVVEKHYVSRVTCFTNVLALNVHFLPIRESGLWLGLYSDLGLVLGAWGFLHYMKQESLGKGYYQISYILYSSLVIGAVILYPHIEWVFSAILGGGTLPATGMVVIAIFINLVLLDDEDRLHYRLARDIRVNEFIVNSPYSK